MMSAGRWTLAGHPSSGRAREVLSVSLSGHEQQELDSIGDEIARADPALPSLLATFARLAADEELRAREQIRAARQIRGRRQPPLPGTFRLPGGTAMSQAR